MFWMSVSVNDVWFLLLIFFKFSLPPACQNCQSDRNRWAVWIYREVSYWIRPKIQWHLREVSFVYVWLAFCAFIIWLIVFNPSLTRSSNNPLQCLPYNVHSFFKQTPRFFIMNSILDLNIWSNLLECLASNFPLQCLP